jgi:hypothetical protein
MNFTENQRKKLAMEAGEITGQASAIRAHRDFISPEPGKLTDPAAIATWYDLNRAQAHLTRAAELVAKVAGVSLGVPMTEVVDMGAKVLAITIDLDGSGQPKMAEPGPDWDWPEEDQPWRGGGVRPGE